MRLSLFGALALVLAVSGCGKDTGTSPTANVPFSTVDVRAGTGVEATTGRNVNVNYSLYLYSATAAENKGRAMQAGNFSFVVGTGVIPGFSQGVQGMRVGGLRRVVIPPNLAYGAQGQDDIPGNATLVFDIELLAVQ